MERRERILRYSVVAIVTIVLWVWANNATTETREVYSLVTISLPTSMQETGELVSPRAPFTASVTCAGPEAALDQAERKLAEVRLVAGEDGLPDGLTTTDLPLESALQAILDRASINARIRSIGSEVPKLEVQMLSRIPMRVVPVLEGARVEGEPVVAPALADLFLPSSLQEQASRIRLEALVDPAEIAGKESGRRHTLSATIRAVLEGGEVLTEGVRVIPPTAEVAFTLASRTVTATLASDTTSAPGIPVQLALPPRDLDRYSVALDPMQSFLRNVVVSGSPEAIDQVNQGRAKIIAFVQLSSDDLDRAALAGGTIEKPISLWQLPPGVTIVDPGRTDYQIEQARDPDLPLRTGVVVEVRPRT
jgi:hypothetical protein